MSLASRTRLVAVLTTLTVGSVGVTTWAYGDATTSEPAAAPSPSVTEGTVLQVVAHPDDDLYFMNPDVSHTISTGIKVTTVYLTAGQSDGHNEAHQGSLQDPVRPPDHAAYAEARQNGVRAAYAQMATGNRASAWQRRSIPTVAGGSAEVDVLVARPEVNLVWMQLREAGQITKDVPVSLRGLWDGRVPSLGVQLSSETPVRKTRFSYSKDQVVEAIAEVFARYRPTTIRMQDPTPGRNADHQDHIYGARFAQAAAERYAKSTGRPHFSVQNYMSYTNTEQPSALGPQAAAEKLGYLKTFAWMDHKNWCGSPAGCGDRKVATRPEGAEPGWTRTIRYGRGDGSSWMTEGAPGKLWAFSVLDGRMAYWSRGGFKAPWQGPRFLAGTGMDAGASAVRLPDGRVGVFGTRTTLGSKAQEYKREVVYSVQAAPDGAFGPWRSLGTPDRDHLSDGSAISSPAVALDRTGRMTVYVRDSRRTLRASAQSAPDGAFGAWASLGGSDLWGDPVTATDTAGRCHVYAATATVKTTVRPMVKTKQAGVPAWLRPEITTKPASVLAWVQRAPDAPFGPPVPTELPGTAGPLSAVPQGDGVALYFRRPGSGTVEMTLVSSRPTGPRFSRITELGGQGGYGSVGVAGDLLAGRSGTGTVASSDTDRGPSWLESQMYYTGAPAALAPLDGPAIGAVLGLDARLHLTTPPPSAPKPRGNQPPYAPWCLAVPPPQGPPEGAPDSPADPGWQH